MEVAPYHFIFSGLAPVIREGVVDEVVTLTALHNNGVCFFAKDFVVYDATPVANVNYSRSGHVILHR